MKMPRGVSGEQLADHLCRHWDYVRVRQAGSHIVLRTEMPSRKGQVVPAHKTLALGTLLAVLHQVAEHKGVTRDDLLRDL